MTSSVIFISFLRKTLIFGKTLYLWLCFMKKTTNKVFLAWIAWKFITFWPQGKGCAYSMKTEKKSTGTYQTHRIFWVIEWDVLSGVMKKIKTNGVHIKYRCALTYSFNFHDKIWLKSYNFNTCKKNLWAWSWCGFEYQLDQDKYKNTKFLCWLDALSKNDCQLWLRNWELVQPIIMKKVTLD